MFYELFDKAKKNNVLYFFTLNDYYSSFRNLLLFKPFLQVLFYIIFIDTNHSDIFKFYIFYIYNELNLQF